MRDFPGAPVKTAEASDPRRTLLLEFLQTGLARVHGRYCVATALAGKAPPAPVWVAAVGKAATAMLTDFETALREQLRAALGPGYGIEIAATPDPPPPAVALPPAFLEAHELAQHPARAQRYDVTVRFTDGAGVTYRVLRMPGGAPLPRNLFLNLSLLVLLLVIVLYAAARNITRPLSDLAHAADSVGRDTRPAQPLAERGARELRDAARAFNTMGHRASSVMTSGTSWCGARTAPRPSSSRMPWTMRIWV